MTQDKHTALPWEVDGPKEYRNPNIGLWSIEGGINICGNCTLYDAAFIVRAVNNHYQLVDVLEKAEKALRDAHKYMGRGYIGSHTELFERVLETANQSSQALSNAKGDIDPAA